MLNPLTLEGIIYRIVFNSKNKKLTTSEIIDKVKKEQSWISSRSVKISINKLVHHEHVKLIKSPVGKFYVAITDDLKLPPGFVSAKTVEEDLKKKQSFTDVLWNNIRKLYPF